MVLVLSVVLTLENVLKQCSSESCDDDTMEYFVNR